MKLGPYPINTIHCGECSEMMAALPDECIDLTVTSPPYDKQRVYQGFTFEFEPIAEQLYRITKNGGVVVWVVNDQTKNGCESLTSFKQAIFFVESCGFNLHDTMIYAKTNYVPLTHNRYEQQFEYMFVFSKGKPKTFNPIMIKTETAGTVCRTKHLQTNAASNEKGNAVRSGKHRRADEIYVVKNTKIKPNIWFYAVGKGNTGDKKAFDHPATFPESLVSDHIISWSNPGDVVLDPMMGSGTVAKMAIEQRRYYLGFDISKKYCKLAQSRLMNGVQLSALL
jgi:site-specific DNA-methyltransferase (adenine-specific)